MSESKVTAIRQEISDLKADIDRYQLGVATRDEARERLADWVDRQAQSVNTAALVGSATRTTDRINPELFKASVTTQAEGLEQADISPFLCWLHGDVVKQRLAAELDAMPDSEFSDQPPAARKSALAKSEKTLHELERKEEQLISAAEANGQFIARRRDCRPEIVLDPEVAA